MKQWKRVLLACMFALPGATFVAEKLYAQSGCVYMFGHVCGDTVHCWDRSDQCEVCL